MEAGKLPCVILAVFMLFLWCTGARVPTDDPVPSQWPTWGSRRHHKHATRLMAAFSAFAGGEQAWGRGGTMILKRAWTVWCRPEERAAIRARARAAGVPVSRLVLDLAFAEADSHDGGR